VTRHFGHVTETRSTTLLYLLIDKYTSSGACAVTMFMFTCAPRPVIGCDVMHYCWLSTSVVWIEIVLSFVLGRSERLFSEDSCYWARYRCWGKISKSCFNESQSKNWCCYYSYCVEALIYPSADLTVLLT